MFSISGYGGMTSTVAISQTLFLIPPLKKQLADVKMWTPDISSFNPGNVKCSSQQIKGYSRAWNVWKPSYTSISDAYGNRIETATQTRFSVGDYAGKTMDYQVITGTGLDGLTLTDKFPIDTTLLSKYEKLFLQPTTLVPCKDNSILSISSVAVGKQYESDAVEAIATYMREKIAYRTGGDTTSQIATDVKKRNNGNCEGMAHLMLAMLRSRGIPARFCGGFALDIHETFPTDASGAWRYTTWPDDRNDPSRSHATIEVYYPSIKLWVPYDPQGAIHFRFSNTFVAGIGRDADDCRYSATYSIVDPDDRRSVLTLKTIHTKSTDCVSKYKYQRTDTYTNMSLSSDNDYSWKAFTTRSGIREGMTISSGPATFGLSVNGNLINYHLPTASHVKLTILEVSGKEVASLVDEFVPKGTKSAMFEAKTLASGTYLCRFQAGAYTATKTLFLFK